MMRCGVVIGTRPEAIKLAPVIAAMRQTNGLRPVVILTGQHESLLTPIIQFFNIQPDIQLSVMQKGQGLGALHAHLLLDLDPIMGQLDAIMVQGDTTSALAGAMSGFYHHCPVFHVEAGLRTPSIESPFPEEWNRRVIDELAVLKFAPTPLAYQTLVTEGRGNGAYMVGNSVIDALELGLRTIQDMGEAPYQQWANDIGWQERSEWVLLTTHRRENIGDGLTGILTSVRQLVAEFPTMGVIIPVHQNPHFKDRITQAFNGVAGVKLVPPLSYDRLLWLMSQCRLILTDSGGIQEEAPSLNKPVLVLRDTTERPEGVAAGCALCVGTNPDRIMGSVRRILLNPDDEEGMKRATNPYGDGTTSQQIMDYILQWRETHV